MAASPLAGTARGQAGGTTPSAPPRSLASPTALVGPPGKRDLRMIPPEERKAQPLPVLGRRWARQGQSEPRLRDPREGAQRGDVPVPGAPWAGAGAAGGRSPKAGPTDGHQVVLVNQAGGEAFGSASSQAKPGATASPRYASPPRGLPAWHPQPPSRSCGSGTFVFQFSFPRTATRSITSRGMGLGAAATLCPSAPLRFSSSRLSPSLVEPLSKGFSLQWDPLGGREELPGQGCCSAWGRRSTRTLAH